MDGLRWLLLLFGLLVVAGVWFYSRRESRKTAKPRSARGGRIEPSLEAQDATLDDELYDEPYESFEADEEPEPAARDDASKPEQKIVTVRLVARRHGAFPGDELILGLRGIGLRHGKFGIFHRYEGDDERRVVFSAASLVEPGTFDLANISSQQIPGISLFLVLPGPMDGASAFDLMMTAARALAQSLDGELLDESGSTLSIQRERYLREEIIQYQHGIKVA
jgi:cell division protein ZipA